MSHPIEASTDQRNDEIEGLYAEALRLPEVPKDVRQFGAAIESVKLMLHRLSTAIGELQEEAALTRARVTAEVRGEKATANEKDKRRIAELLASDGDLQVAEASGQPLGSLGALGRPPLAPQP